MPIDASQKRLLDVTGGWLLLLEDALQHADARRSAHQICDAILTRLETLDGADRLVTASGIRSLPVLGGVFNQLAVYDDWLTESEFTELIADIYPAAGSVLRHLRLLAALDERGSDGALRRACPRACMADDESVIHGETATMVGQRHLRTPLQLGCRANWASPWSPCTRSAWSEP